jgi:hypothetical protein
MLKKIIKVITIAIIMTILITYFEKTFFPGVDMTTLKHWVIYITYGLGFFYMGRIIK